MSLKPILFKPEMVNAILREEKTQTRRIVKPQPSDDGLIMFAHWAELWCSVNGRASWDANPWVRVYTFARTTKP